MHILEAISAAVQRAIGRGANDRYATREASRSKRRDKRPAADNHVHSSVLRGVMYDKFVQPFEKGMVEACGSDDRKRQLLLPSQCRHDLITIDRKVV